MTQLLNSAVWSSALEPTIKTWFMTTLDSYPDMIPTLFNVIASTKYDERFQSASGITSDRWNAYRQNKLVPSVGATPEYESSFKNEPYTVDLPIDQMLIEDGSFNIVEFMTQELAESAMQKRQSDAASVFNNAFSSSFLGADGVALCADNHPGAAGAQDNKDTLALTEANVNTVKVAMQTFKRGSGDLAGIIPDLVIIPPALEKTAQTLFTSELLPGSANNDVNVNFGMRYMKWNYLTDSNNWFMVDSRRMKRFLMWINRVPLSIVLEGAKTTANQAVYNARMRYSFGWTDWRWIYGLEVA